MRRSTRRRLQLLFGLGTALLAGAWLMLRLGRPMLYVAEDREIAASEREDPSLLLWQEPVAHGLVPGPVRGRLARLPDGRCIYGRASGATRTELVLFDPRQPERAPEPLFAVRGRGHDLAPALGPDGRLWFASDRVGGRGGFDLWCARPAGEGFGTPEPWEHPANTELDECDPCPAPQGDALVFVRRDPTLRGGQNGLLLHAGPGGAVEALFASDAPLRGEHAPFDRDPILDAAGDTLWFVRRDAKGARIWRSRRLAGVFGAPRPFAAGAGRALRSPLPLEGGLAVEFVEPRGDEALLLRADALEALPWQPAWQGLERQLLLALVVFAALLVLLHLGDRWRKLDVVTQCLIFSLLLHVLVLLVVGGAQLVRSFETIDAGEERMTLRLRPAPQTAGAARVSASVSEFVRTAQLPRQAAPLELAGPAAGQLASGGARRSAPLAATLTPRRVDGAQPSLRDRAPRATPRHGTDASERALAARDLSPMHELAPETAARSRAAAPPVADPVTGPAAGRLATLARRVPSAEASGRVAARPLDRAQLAEAEPSRAVAPAARRSGTDPAAPGALAERALERLEAQRAPASRPGRVRSVRGATLEPDAPDGALAGLAPSRRPVPHLAAGPQPERPVLPERPGLRDAAEAVPADVPAVAAQPESGPVRPRALEALSGPERGSPPAPGLTRARRPARGAAELPVGRATGGMARSARRSAGTAPAAAPRALAATPVAAVLPAPRAVAAPAGASEAVPSARPLSPRSLPALVPSAVSLPRPERGPDARAAQARREPWVAPQPSLERAARRAGSGAERALPEVFANRVGAQKAAALERYGGTAATEAAVRRGLAYLARIQQPDGGWGRRAGRQSGKYGDTRIGRTGLCLLALLGAGHAPGSGTEHEAVVQRGFAWLLEQQRSSGHFGNCSAYGHGIATYAVAECAAMTNDPAWQQRLLPPLRAACLQILRHQNQTRDPRSFGGWPYYSDTLRREDGFSRVSVSAWQIMALESAKLSGFEIEAAVLRDARSYLLHSFDAEHGYFLYNREPGRLRSRWRTLPASTPAALFCLLLTGTPAEDELVQAALPYVLERRPRNYRRHGDDAFVREAAGNVYFWYYGSLACFLAGGQAWESWNQQLRRILPEAQSEDGSFAPIDVYAEYAGDTAEDRAYSTAMCVLTLEVYYRYFTPLLRAR